MDDLAEVIGEGRQVMFSEAVLACEEEVMEALSDPEVLLLLDDEKLLVVGLAVSLAAASSMSDGQFTVGFSGRSFDKVRVDGVVVDFAFCWRSDSRASCWYCWRTRAPELVTTCIVSWG